MAIIRDNVIHINDLSLVRRLLRGDHDAFRKIFDEYYDRLYRFALVRVKFDEPLAEDIVQQCMTKAIHRFETYKGEASLYTWLCTICRNSIIDYQRKQGLYDDCIVLAEDHLDLRTVLESFVAPDAYDPLIDAQRQELSRSVQVVLDQLPKHYGDVLEWKYILGWSVQEIADHMNIGKPAAQSVLARARSAFADIFGSFPELPITTEK